MLTPQLRGQPNVNPAVAAAGLYSLNKQQPQPDANGLMKGLRSTDTFNQLAAAAAANQQSMSAAVSAALAAAAAHSATITSTSSSSAAAAAAANVKNNNSEVDVAKSTYNPTPIQRPQIGNE